MGTAENPQGYPRQLIQAAALKYFKDQNEAQAPFKEKKSQQRRSYSRDNAGRYNKKSTKKGKHSCWPAETQPSAKIAPKSYLSAALKTVDWLRRSRHYSSSSSSSSSRSASPSSRSSPSDDGLKLSSSPDESEESEHHYHSKRWWDNHHGRNRHCRHYSSSSSSSRSHIKPIPPEKYDRQADVRTYHWFMCESDAYLRDGKVWGTWKVFLLSYYLTGKAYNFYTQKVAINEEDWTVPQFYKGLFDFCFLVDYWMQLRKTLAHCHQNDKTGRVYTWATWFIQHDW